MGMAAWASVGVVRQHIPRRDPRLSGADGIGALRRPFSAIRRPGSYRQEGGQDLWLVHPLPLHPRGCSLRRHRRRSVRRRRTRILRLRVLLHRRGDRGIRHVQVQAGPRLGLLDRPRADHPRLLVRRHAPRQDEQGCVLPDHLRVHRLRLDAAGQLAPAAARLPVLVLPLLRAPGRGHCSAHKRAAP